MRTKAAVFLVSLVALAGCDGSDLRNDDKKQLSELGFTALYPPRENFGPGLVFQALPSGAAPQLSIVCKTLLKNAELLTSNAALPSSKVFNQNKFGLGLSLAKGLVGDIRSAEANLIKEKAKNLTVSFEGGKIEELPDEARFNENGTKHPIVPSCAAALKQFKTANKLQRNVFIVKSALLANKTLLKVDFEGESSAKASIDVKSLFDIKPGIEARKKGNSEIQFDSPLYLGYNAMALTEFVPITDLGPESGVIKARELTSQEIELLAKAQ